MFPKVTYNRRVLLTWGHPEKPIDFPEDFWEEMSEDAIYSSVLWGIIWLRKPSIKWLIHEFCHHVGYSLGLPLWFHKLIHKIF